MRRLLRWAFDGVAAVSLLLCVGVVVQWMRGGGSVVFNSRRIDGRTISGSSWCISLNDGFVFLIRPRFLYRYDDPEDDEFLNDRWSSLSSQPRLEYSKRPVPASLPQMLDMNLVSGWNRLGFGYWREGDEFDNSSVGFDQWKGMAPAWLVPLALGLLPLWRVIVNVRQYRLAIRARLGCCRLCGYDLRATPDRCPECGAVPGQGR